MSKEIIEKIEKLEKEIQQQYANMLNKLIENRPNDEIILKITKNQQDNFLNQTK